MGFKVKLTRHVDAVELAVSHDPDLLKRVFLRNGVGPILQLSEFTLAPGKNITPHTHHDAIEVFYMLEGQVMFTVDGSDAIISTGDVLVVEAGEEHSLSSVSNDPARFFYFLLLNH